jgi:integrase
VEKARETGMCGTDGGTGAGGEGPENLAYYCSCFFSPRGRWAERMGEKGHHYGEEYLNIRQGHLDNYVIPSFGNARPTEIKRREIDNWLLGLRRLDGGKMAGATKNKILYTLSIVFEELVDLEVVEKNPVRGIKPYNKTPVHPRGVIDRQALAKLFPGDHRELLEIWESVMWASMMLVFYDTGARPGEVRALTWADLNIKKRFIPIRKGVQAGSRDIIKTTKTNIVRIGFLTAHTVEELEIWRRVSAHSGERDFIFTIDGKHPISAVTVIRAFKRGLSRAGITGKPWTPYWLRHSFGTYHMEHLNQAELMNLMGHNTAATTRLYQHPDNDTLYHAAEHIKAKLDRFRE